MKLIILLLLITISLSAQDTTYRRYITINGVTTSTSKGITAYVKGLEKTIDSLKNVTKFDSSFIASIPFAESFYKLDNTHPKKYYSLDSCADYSKRKITVTIEYKVENKARTFKFIDDE